MTMNKILISAGAALSFGVLAIGGTAVALTDAASPQSSAPQTDWTKRVTVSKTGGHILGNPLARKRLVEYVSYSCPHCATYAAQSAAPIEASYISKGSVSVEVRSFVRDPFDFAAALLARCGKPAQFFGNHRAILAQQKTWLARASTPDAAMQERWKTQDLGKRMQFIANDIGLNSIMQKRGLSLSVMNQCLANKSAHNQLIEMTHYAANEVKITGTPAFTINDKYQAKTHSWPALEPKLRSAFGGL